MFAIIDIDNNGTINLGEFIDKLGGDDEVEPEEPKKIPSGENQNLTDKDLE